MTVEEFAQDWLRLHPRPADSSNRQYAFGVRPFLNRFGRRRLDSIDYREARKFAVRNRSAARYARALYADAMRDGLADRNPFSNLRLPQSIGRADLEVLTDEEVERLVEATGKHSPKYSSEIFTASISLLAYTGVRLGELLALNFIHLHGDEAHVVSQLRPDGQIAATKGKRKRQIVVPPPAQDALSPILRAADGLPRVGRVFPFSRRSFYRTWGLAVRDAGLEVSPHCLRHYCATWMLARGASYRQIAMQLGHVNESLCRNLYCHPDEKRERDRLKEVLGAV